jgi:glycosyltransferase involved in cell wall biosynthesis
MNRATRLLEKIVKHPVMSAKITTWLVCGWVARKTTTLRNTGSVKTDNTKVSVLVPAYNVSKTVRQSISSILASKHHNLEIIIVDDGSTDETLKILRELEKEDDRIRVLTYKTNQGLFAARRTALNAMTGEYFLTVDSDDTIRPNLISDLLKYAIKNPNTDIVLGRQAYSVTLFGDFSDYLHKLSNDMYGWNWKNKLFAARLYDEKCKKDIASIKKRIVMGEDILYATILKYYVGDNVIASDVVGYEYNSDNAESSTNSLQLDKKLADLVVVFKYLEAFLKRHREYDNNRNQLEKFRALQEWHTQQHYR